MQNYSGGGGGWGGGGGGYDYDDQNGNNGGSVGDNILQENRKTKIHKNINQAREYCEEKN